MHYLEFDALKEKEATVKDKNVVNKIESGDEN